MLPTKIAKRIAGTCLHCSEPAMEDSDYCAPHDARERGMRANRQRRLRQRRADAGLCVAGCGRKVAKRRRPDGSVQLRECRVCAKAHRERSRRARVRNAEARAVTSSRPGFRLTVEASPDGVARARLRYHGKGSRGRMSNAVIDQQDLDEAIQSVERGARALALYHGDEGRALPRVQRDEVREEGLDYLRQAQRWLDEVIERHEG